MRDTNRYSVDVFLLQETKIKIQAVMDVMAALLKPFTLVIGFMERTQSANIGKFLIESLSSSFS